MARSEFGQDYRDIDKGWKTVKFVKPKEKQDHQREFGQDYSDYNIISSRISTNMDFLKNYVKEGWAKMVNIFPMIL